MHQGKVNSALNSITEGKKGGVLPLTPEVISALTTKHPPAEPLDQLAVLPITPPVVNTILFAGLSAEVIRKSAIATHGAAGPSGGDADQWRHMCVAFRTASNSLCDSMAAVARRMATESLDPRSLEAFLANRLIPLDKCPGVRPIGIGETPRRIISKAIVSFLKEDIRSAAGALQLCCGQESGCESIVHAMRSVYEKDDTEAILLVDADNAFNRLNRAVALRNIRVVCPAVAIFAMNSYRAPSRLFVTGGAELSSQEGTTQGDPLAMPFYALSMMPLIQQIHGIATQAWYADDAQACGNLFSLRQWWDQLVSKGPSYGYYANASKTILIVKSSRLEAAQSLFAGTGVQFADGARDLGGAIGSDSYTSVFLEGKVKRLCEQVAHLSTIAKVSPQAAHSAFLHGIRHKWTYLQRIHPGVSSLFEPLERVIREKFIPALLGGRQVSDIEREMLALPAKRGGMGLDDPTTSCEHQHSASLRATAKLTENIQQQDIEATVNQATQRAVKAALAREIDERQRERADDVRQNLPPNQQRAMLISQEKGASFFITTLPLARYGFTLTKGEFLDAVLLRYMWPLPNLPSQCVCGSPFTVEHSQMCHMGGFINMRHDSIKTLLAAEMREVLRDVQLEPSLTPLSGEVILPASANREPDARADIRARGFWTEQQSAYFDIRVFYPHAPSYLPRSLPALCKTFEEEKKRRYGDRIREVQHGSFTPLVFSSCGGMGLETGAALRKLASMAAEKRHEPYHHTISLLRMRLHFALLRASFVCLRGTRTRHNAFPNYIPADVVLHELRVDE